MYVILQYSALDHSFQKQIEMRYQSTVKFSENFQKKIDLY